MKSLRTLSIAVVIAVLGPAGRTQCPPVQNEILQVSTENFIEFGASMDMDSGTLIIGAPKDDEGSTGLDTGSVQVHRRSGSHGLLAGSRITPGPQAGLLFGTSVAVSGADAIVGAPGDDKAAVDSGAAWLLHRVKVNFKPTWVLGVKLKGSNQPNGKFGTTVAMGPGIAVVGADGTDEVYVFEDNGSGVWIQTAKLTEPSPFSGQSFGAALATDGASVWVGSPGLQIAPYGVVHRFTQWAGPWSFLTWIYNPLQSSGNFGAELAYESPRLFVGDTSWRNAYSFQGSTEVGRVEFGIGPKGLDLAAGLDGLVVGIPDIEEARVFDSLGLEEVLRVEDPTCVLDCSYGTRVAADGHLAVVGLQTQGVFAGRVYSFDTSNRCVTYCTAGRSSAGCRSWLTPAGTPSASAPSGFVLTARQLEGDKDGLFFFSTNGRQASPWGNGSSYQCVVPPVTRAGLLPGTGTPGTCTGTLSQDLNALWCPSCPKPTKNPGAGAVVQAQLWYRDPFNTSNQTTSMSEAIEFTVAP
jgi:hypothetical protein